MKVEFITTKRVITLNFFILSDNKIDRDGNVCNHCPCRRFCNSSNGVMDFCAGISEKFSRDWREEHLSCPLNIEEVLREIRKNPIRDERRID